MRKFALSIIVVMLLAMLPAGTGQTTDLPPEQFSINLLTPNSNPNRASWAELIQGELPKAGIQVDAHLISGWDVIGPRTFSYQVDDPAEGIPTHDNGGYDLFFVGLSGGLDYDPTGSYSSTALSPWGLNFAYYQNAQVDTLIEEYTSTLSANERINIAEDIQQIIFEDVPYIPIVHTESTWSFNENLTLNDDQLLFLSSSNMGSGLLLLS